MSWWNVDKDKLWHTDGYQPNPGFAWALSSLFSRAVKEEQTLLKSYHSGYVEEKDFIDKLEKEFDGRIVYIRGTDSVDPRLRCYVKKDGYLIIEGNSSGGIIEIELLTTDSEMDKKIEAHCKALKEVPPKGEVHVLAVNNNGSMTFRSIGSMSIPFEPKNYTDDVADSYRHIVEDLKSQSPCGRLILLNGEPGTGKTFFVKGLISEDVDVKFIILPPELISSITGPQFISSLIKDRGEDQPVPIVLIIEDADSCIAERGVGDMGSVSSILNLGDGIVGSLLDIRILATTNQDSVNIDPALTRPGRLCKALTISELDQDSALDIFERLVGKRPEFLENSRTKEEGFMSSDTVKGMKHKLTLAEVYKQARDAGWVPPPTKIDKSKHSKLGPPELWEE